MREDMAKVIVERPRLGGGTKFPRGSSAGYDRVPQEDWHRREGMKRAWISDPKGLNENLAPLQRYLRSHLGRPWDKVYSEICQRINRNSAVQLHIWQHLSNFVCTNPYGISGDVGGRCLEGGGPWATFYVHPRTGLLLEKVRSRRRRSSRWTVGPPVPDHPRVRGDATREYRRIDGIWYELALAPLPHPPAGVYDMALRKAAPALTVDELWHYYGRKVYAVKKRQLNKREIRRLPPTE